MPSYLDQILAKESTVQPAPPDTLQLGHFYAARHNGRWHRVCLIGDRAAPSNSPKMPDGCSASDFCRVFLADVGVFAGVRRADIRLLTKPGLCAPTMLAFKCRLAGIKPPGVTEYWGRDAQRALQTLLMEANGKEVELGPGVQCTLDAVGNWTTWQHESESKTPVLPMIECKLLLSDGRDVADCLVKSGVAVRI